MFLSLLLPPAAAAAALLVGGCGRSKKRVVLYSAQDREFAEPVLEAFTKESGLEVASRYDTEGNKSVGFYREIVAEAQKPRCDVYWNNEIIWTIQLQKQGLLESHASPSAKSYPEWAKAADHTWHAFASRARVLIVNNQLVPKEKRPRSLLDLTAGHWKDRVVMAKPVHGTTATQATCLFEVLGSAEGKKYYTGLKDNGTHIAPGNKDVAEWVAQGKTATGKVAAIGMTDTDDAIGQLKSGKDVTILFPDRDGGMGAAGRKRMGTLFIPNTLCIPKGCPNLDGACKLVDYLLRPEVEKALAEGPGSQIPINPEVKATLPPQIETPATVKAMQVNWARAAELEEEARAHMIELFGS
jgi:iron(III) transport system substrate-binding protein